MKRTLLDITQSILSSMDSDEVNSISDTVESLQVANCVKDSYYMIISDKYPENYSLFQLDATTTSSPTIMSLPSNVHTVEWVKYNISDTAIPNFSEIEVMPLKDFIEHVQTFDTSNSAFYSYSFSFNGDDIQFNAYKDVAPTKYTVVNDKYFVFDSWNNSVETNLQKSKTICYGLTIPTFSMEDTFIPDLDALEFDRLYNEAKRQAFIELKQAANPVAEKRARINQIKAQKYKNNNGRVGPNTSSFFNSLPNYGRK